MSSRNRRRRKALPAVSGALAPVQAAATPAASPAPRSSVRQSDPTREYLAGGTMGAFTYSPEYLRTLPFWIDDISRDFGDDIYDRMALDPEVAKCVNLLKMAVLAQGISLTLPAGVNEESPDHAQATEILEFCRRQLPGLDSPFSPDNTVPLYWQIWGLLDAFLYGNKLAEIVLQLAHSGPDAGKYCLAALKVKPRRAYAFLVDAWMNVLGIVGIVPGTPAPVLVEGIFTQANEVRNLFPRRRFAVLSFRPKDSDPRGQSIGRAAYEPWWTKKQAWSDFLRYLAESAAPSLIGFTAPDASPVIDTDADGNPVDDGAGGYATVDPEEAMFLALQNFRNGTAAAFPHGADVKWLETTNQGQAFLSALELCNREISTAILCQTLATSEAQHQARASSETHQDTLGLVVAHGKAALATCLRNDVLRNLVEYNFGPDAARLTPAVQLADTANQDFAAEVTALAGAGYSVDPSQFPKIDARLGLPERSAESVQAAIDRLNAPPMPQGIPGEKPGANDNSPKPGNSGKPANSSKQSGPDKKAPK